MQKINNEKLRNFLRNVARNYQMLMIDKKKDLFCMKENYHFFTHIDNEIFCWELQSTVDLTKQGLIHSMTFLHPIIINEETKLSYIEFANMANIYLGSAMGRFWVNEEYDYCYECFLPEDLLNNGKELERQLFDIPFAHFKDCLTPLMKMKDGEWDSKWAIEYLVQLREEGYVDNREYEIW